VENPSASSYDEIPYYSKPFAVTHPDHLAAVATLYGMEPPDVDRCRVLELGCAAGGNLMPMAVGLPQARFVGIDLSARQIEDGSAIVRALGLTNIDLRAMSILDVSRELGEFDYIICHGVYSWVPPEVQERILQIAAENLAPHGVAYVSYNTYPGWHLRGMVREMLCYHVRKFKEPRERLEQARAFLGFLIAALPDSSTAYGQMLQEEEAQLREANESYVFHEHLEAVNLPLYFHEFMQRAAAHRLQFVAEARFTPHAEFLSADAMRTVQQWGEDVLEREQYFDFLRRASFRRTLLAHAGIHLQRQPQAEQLSRLWFTTVAQPASACPDLRPGVVERFGAASGVSFTTDQPEVKALFTFLNERSPRPASLLELKSEVEARTKSGADVTPKLVTILLRCIQANLITLHSQLPATVFDVSNYPVANILARLQAETDDSVASLRNYLVPVTPLVRELVRLLDGTRDQATLAAQLTQLALDDPNRFSFVENDEPMREPARIAEFVTRSVESALPSLAAHSVLVG
jgi:SAM-dependent methyltransferase